MFIATCAVLANDVTANHFVRAASCVGNEGRDWVREWRDGGMLAFSFKNAMAMTTFQAWVVLLS
jgi:hypothetical protein